MTMQNTGVIDAISLQNAGFQPIVVEPGSPDDPFSVHNQTVSAPPPASPVVIAGTAPVVAGDGPKASEPLTPATPQPAPVTPAEPGTSAPASDTPAVPAIDPATLAGLIKEEVGKALRGQQSSYDKRINELQTQLVEAQKAETQRERDSKLASDELTDEEKDLLREKWSLADEKAKLDEYADSLDAFYRTQYVASLVSEAGRYGVTADDLEALSEPEEMDRFVLEKELEFLRSGGSQVAANTVPANTVVTPAVTPNAPEPQAPAGASAPSDLGGAAPDAPRAQPEQGMGLDVLARNLNSMGWSSLPTF